MAALRSLPIGNPLEGVNPMYPTAQGGNVAQFSQILKSTRYGRFRAVGLSRIKAGTVVGYRAGGGMKQAGNGDVSEWHGPRTSKLSTTA